MPTALTRIEKLYVAAMMKVYADWDNRMEWERVAKRIAENSREHGVTLNVKELNEIAFINTDIG